MPNLKLATSFFYRHQTGCYLLLGLLFLIINAAIYLQNQAHSFYFEDETEHVTLAWMMRNYDSTLYRDLSTNHQPLPILVAFLFLSVIKFTTLFRFISLLRLGMILISAAGAGIVIWRFKLQGLLSVIVLETIKVYFLGYHLLAESLVIYAVVFLTALLIEKIFIHPAQTSLHDTVDAILSAVAIWIIGFNLAMLWPFLIISLIMLFWVSTNHSKKIFGLTALILVASIFLVIPPVEWFRESVSNVLTYFLPYQASVTGPTSLWRVLFFPLLAFSNLNTLLGLFLSIQTLILTYSIWQSRKKIKKIKSLLMGLLIYLLIVSLNPRIDQIDVIYYTGFHLLPFLAGYLTLTIAASLWTFQALPRKNRTQNLIILTCLFIPLIFISSRWYGEQKDVLTEHIIQYQRFEIIGTAIASLRQPGQNLWVGPIHGYLNLVAHLPLADRQNAHLDWALNSPILYQEFIDEMENHPPDYIYYPDHGHDRYYQLILPYLQKEYTSISTQDHKQTEFYILTQNLDVTSPDNWQTFRNLNLEPPRTLLQDKVQ